MSKIPWWKIIFVLLVFNSVYTYVIKAKFQFTLLEYLLVFTDVILLVGIYSYAFKKKILTPNFWRIFFWVYIVTFVLIFILPTKNGHIEIGYPELGQFSDPINLLALAIIMSVFGLIRFYPLYQLAYKSKKK